MELNEMEKKMLFQAEGDCQAKVLNELYMTVRYSNNSELREAAESLMAKVRVLSDRECMDLVRDIQKNYRLPHPPRTIGERIAEARQQSGAEKLKGHTVELSKRILSMTFWFPAMGRNAWTRLWSLCWKRCCQDGPISALPETTSHGRLSGAGS